MHEAGAVEQHVDAADLLDPGGNVIVAQHVEFARRDAGRSLQFLQRRFIDIGRMHSRAGPRERQGRCLADALRGGGEEDNLAFEASGHVWDFPG